MARIYVSDDRFDSKVIKVYRVDSKYDADVLVYKVDSKYDAEWRTNHQFVTRFS